MLYDNKNDEPEITVYQEDLRKVGININLRLVTPETLFQLVSNRQFQMVQIAWGGLAFPNPETSFRSSLADSNNNNNITGFKNVRVDQLCDAYDKMFDVKDRIKAIREIDGILANDYQYALAVVRSLHSIGLLEQIRHAAGLFAAHRRFLRHAAVVVDRSRQGCGSAEGDAQYFREARSRAGPRTTTGMTMRRRTRSHNNKRRGAV